ncbi:MAG: hypothetical protein HY872_16125 [Chloroflexi bacterium]|nr:hypothetical protein [Chloroflexota bacterium]MBI5293403.1 hypothetical protein [Chloroflexota bacterium]
MPKPKIDPKRPLAAQAVMNVDKGEEIAGMWVTKNVPQVGIYKLLAKKKKDGTCEWAHFVQRDSGLKENVYRGTVENKERLNDVVTSINAALRKAYGPGVSLQIADFDTYNLAGKQDSGVVH